MASLNPEQIAKALSQASERKQQLEAKCADLQAENGQLRTASKKAADLEAKLDKAQEQAKADSKRAQDAEMRVNRLTADLASANAKNARLAGILQHVQEREAASKEVEKLLKGVS